MQLQIRHRAVLVSLVCVFVGLPPTLMMLSIMERQLMQMFGTISGGILGDQAGMIILMWAAIPGSIFGEPAFKNSMFFGIVPAGNLGWVLTVLFWTVISIIFWFATVIFRRKKTHRRIHKEAEQDAT